jgi:hypothetical protein
MSQAQQIEWPGRRVFTLSEAVELIRGLSAANDEVSETQRVQTSDFADRGPDHSVLARSALSYGPADARRQ